jgi:PleD family two-component response regulator
MSFGVTDAKAFLKQADAAMYQAKSEGKHRVHRYVDPVDHLVGFA